MKHLAAVVAADDRQVAVSNCPRITNYRQISAADRYNVYHIYRQYKGAITSTIKNAIKLKTSPARLAQLLQPSLALF